MRRFECEDCGCQVERKWQCGRPKVCIECAKIRTLVIANAARDALEAHKRACRLELLARRTARPSQVALLAPLLDGAGGELAAEVSEATRQ